MAKVLLFQCKNEDRIRAILASMKISAVSVPEDYFYLTLGEIERGGNLFACSVQDVPKEILSVHSVRKASPEGVSEDDAGEEGAKRVLRENLTAMREYTETGKEAVRFSQESMTVASEFAEPGKAAERSPQESMVVMCGFTEKQMNRFLEKLKKESLPVDYKAVLTATNRSWNVRRMYLEMARERAMYLQMEKEKQ